MLALWAVGSQGEEERERAHGASTTPPAATPGEPAIFFRSARLDRLERRGVRRREARPDPEHRRQRDRERRPARPTPHVRPRSDLDEGGFSGHVPPEGGKRVEDDSSQREARDVARDRVAAFVGTSCSASTPQNRSVSDKATAIRYASDPRCMHAP